MEADGQKEPGTWLAEGVARAARMEVTVGKGGGGGGGWGRGCGPRRAEWGWGLRVVYWRRVWRLGANVAVQGGGGGVGATAGAPAGSAPRMRALPGNAGWHAELRRPLPRRRGEGRWIWRCCLAVLPSRRQRVPRRRYLGRYPRAPGVRLRVLLHCSLPRLLEHVVIRAAVLATCGPWPASAQ